MIHEVTEQLFSTGLLQDKVKCFLSVNHFKKKSPQVEEIQGLCDWDFVGQSLEAGRVLLDIVDDHHSHLFPGKDVQSQVHVGEVASPC